MLNNFHRLTQKIRPWLLAAAAIFALVSVLEAGHVHGVFSQADDQCTLCQHSFTLDKAANSPTYALFAVLLATVVILFIPQFRSYSTLERALIRAPPAQFHTR